MIVICFHQVTKINFDTWNLKCRQQLIHLTIKLGCMILLNWKYFSKKKMMRKLNHFQFFILTHQMIHTRSKLYIPALTLPFSSVFFDPFSITLLYTFKQKSPKNEIKLKWFRFFRSLLSNSNFFLSCYWSLNRIETTCLRQVDFSF